MSVSRRLMGWIDMFLLGAARGEEAGAEAPSVDEGAL